MPGLNRGVSGLWGGASGLWNGISGLWGGASGLIAGGGVPVIPFVLDINFTASDVLDPRITAIGGTNGTRVNPAGVIVAQAAPRFDYDPVTLAPRGLKIEETRQNLFTGALIGGGGLITQNVTVTAAPTTISFYGPGTIDLTGAFVGTVVGTGAYPNRTTLTFTPTAGVLTCSVTGQVQFAQCETGAFASSFIPTAGAPVSRTKEVFTITGTNFSSWYNQVAGTFVISGDVTITPNSIFYTVDDGTATNRLYTWSSGSNCQYVILNAAAQQVNMLLGPLVTGAHFIFAEAYALNDFGGSFNGLPAVQDSLGTMPSVMTQLSLGNASSNGQINGHIQRLAYNPSRLTNAQLQLLSAGGSITGFNPSFNVALVYSLADYIVSRSDATGRRAAMSRTGHDAGQWYAEFAVQTARLRFAGVVDSTFNQVGAGGAAGNNRVGIEGNRLVFAPASSVAMGGFANPGDIVRIAWDADAQRIWVKINNGLWNNSSLADPATGVGGRSTANLGGAGYLGVTLRPIVNAAVDYRLPGDVGYVLPVGFEPWT